MERILHFVELHGVPVVFAAAFLRQLGVPFPAVPVLLVFGALAGEGRLPAIPALLAGVAGSVAADLVWYRIGRWKGTKALTALCRVSLEPDTCVSTTQDQFARHGVKSLLVAKFVPGLDTVAPPLAGMMGIGLASFVAWTSAGAALWLLVFGGLGYVLSDRIAELAATADRWTGTIGWIAAGLFAVWLAWKIVQRQRVLRLIRMARITPDELTR
jgi:membrane protein DedA with SNARE-associated domain